MDLKKLKNKNLMAKKKSVLGIFERLDLLKKAGLDPSSIEINIEKNSKIKIDDILDSMVLFITALRIVKGNFLCLEKTKIENSDDNGQIFI